MGTYTETSQPADDAARAVAQHLLAAAQHAALAYAESTTGHPGIGRIGLALSPDGEPLTLVSDLARHSAGLSTHPDCAFMVGEPGPKGDPLTHPRLMVTARAAFVERGSDAHAALRQTWLAGHPKAKLYIDFADFRFVRLVPVSALLNAGFGRAFRLTAKDLGGGSA
jgi:putative heme iron utilization protein